MSLRRYIDIFCVLVASAAISGCGAGSGKNKNGEDPLSLYVPYWANITYKYNGVTKTLAPPYVVTQEVFADAGVGACTGNKMEIVFSGTYNPDKIGKLELTGLDSTASFSENSFTFVACMAPGSATVTVTAYDKSNKPIRLPLTVSISAMTDTTTLAYGHPRYPNTGFETTAAAKNIGDSMIGMGASIAKKRTTSTGNTGFTMETGFVNIVHESSP